MARDQLSLSGHQVEVAAGGEQALTILGRESFDVMLLDLRMPPGMDGIEVLQKLPSVRSSVEVVVLSGASELSSAVECLKLGAFDYVSKPVENWEEVETLIQRAAERRELKLGFNTLRRKITPEVTAAVGKSKAWMEIMELARKAAAGDAPVLILGPSGSGKEIVARMIHSMSARTSSLFLPANCSAFTDSLLESELFGHERGAFTGAETERAGLFEVAKGGTVFLDEVFDTSIAMQAKLLRVLESGEIRRVGGTAIRRTNVRLVAASNKNPAAEIGSKRFREDLFYRVAVFTIELPPLSQRREDIPLLISHFLSQLRPGQAVRVDPMAMSTMIAYDWRGNVRELRNVIERALLLSEGSAITMQHLAPNLLIRPSANEFVDEGVSDNMPLMTLKEMEQKMIDLALKHTGGNRTQAARILGIDPRTLRAKLRELPTDEP